jgi:hypothetical protein
MLTDEQHLEGLCQLCATPHENSSPGECRAAAERARLNAELDDLLTEMFTEAGAAEP